MTYNKCSVHGCAEPHLARGFCKHHYSVWFKHKERVSGISRIDRMKALVDMLDYDPESGTLTWKISPGNKTPAGTPAGQISTKGHRRLQFRGRTYAAHRVIWFIHYGEVPDGVIDHINGDPDDNRIVNLRPASHSQNMCNRGIGSNNTTGFKGVTKSKQNGRFYARITKDRVVIPLGSFATAEEAGAAYAEAAKDIHGEFARIV